MLPQQIKTRGVITGIQLPLLMEALQSHRDWTVHRFIEDQDKQVGQVTYTEWNKSVNLTAWLNRPSRIHVQGRYVAEFLELTETIRATLPSNSDNTSGPSTKCMSPTSAERGRTSERGRRSRSRSRKCSPPSSRGNDRSPSSSSLRRIHPRPMERMTPRKLALTPSPDSDQKRRETHLRASSAPLTAAVPTQNPYLTNPHEAGDNPYGGRRYRVPRYTMLPTGQDHENLQASSASSPPKDSEEPTNPYGGRPRATNPYVADLPRENSRFDGRVAQDIGKLSQNVNALDLTQEPDLASMSFPLELSLEALFETVSRGQESTRLVSNPNNFAVHHDIMISRGDTLLAEIHQWTEEKLCPGANLFTPVELLDHGMRTIVYEDTPGHPLEGALITPETIDEHLLGLAVMQEQDQLSAPRWTINALKWTQSHQHSVLIRRPRGSPHPNQQVDLDITASPDILAAQLATPPIQPDGAATTIMTAELLFREYQIQTEQTIQDKDHVLTGMYTMSQLQFALHEDYASASQTTADGAMPWPQMIIHLQHRVRGGGPSRRSPNGLNALADLLRDALSPQRNQEAPKPLKQNQQKSQATAIVPRGPRTQFETPSISEYRLYVHDPDTSARMQQALDGWLVDVKNGQPGMGPGPAVIQVWWAALIQEVDMTAQSTEDAGSLTLLGETKALLLSNHYQMGAQQFALRLEDAIYSMFLIKGNQSKLRPSAEPTPKRRRNGQDMDIDEDSPDLTIWKLVLKMTYDGITLSTILQKVQWNLIFAVEGTQHPMYEARAHRARKPGKGKGKGK